MPDTGTATAVLWPLDTAAPARSGCSAECVAAKAGEKFVRMYSSALTPAIRSVSVETMR